MRDRQNWSASQKREIFLECFLGHLSFWVSGVESPLFFLKKIKKIRKTKYITESFSSLIEQKKLHNWKIEKLHSFGS